MIILKEVSKDSNRFNEMAILRKDKTGLPVNIYLDTKGTYKRGGHGKRIKFQFLSTLIKPPIRCCTSLRRVKLDTS